MKKSFFDTIPGVVRLDSRVAIYVPSTTDTDHPTDNRQQVEEVAAKLSAMFGGATATEARGYWVSQSAGLVGEGIGGGGDHTRNSSPLISRLTASCFISRLILWQMATISAPWRSMSSAAALL